MSSYSEFFLRSESSVVQLECLEISHPAFTQTYRVVRNSVNGISVKYEDNVTYLHTYYPLQIRSLGSRGDLDHGLQINLGDLGDVLPTELDAVTFENAFGVKPIVKYRTFRSDDLLNVLYGPLVLEVKTFSFDRHGATFEAKAPSLNINKTGEIYKIDRFYMLRGLL